MANILKSVLDVLREHQIVYSVKSNVIQIPTKTESFSYIMIEVLSRDGNNIQCRTVFGNRIPPDNTTAFLHHCSKFNTQSFGLTLNYNPIECSAYFLATTNFLSRPRGENLKKFLYDFIYEGRDKLEKTTDELKPFFKSTGHEPLLYLFDHDTALPGIIKDPESADLFKQTNKSVQELIRLIRGKTPVIIVNTQDPQYAKFVIHLAAECLKRDLFLWNRIEKMQAPKDVLLYYTLPENTPWYRFESFTRNFTGDTCRDKMHELLSDLPVMNADERRAFGAGDVKFTTFSDVLAWFRKSIRPYIILAVEDLSMEMTAGLYELREISQCPSEVKTLIIINNSQQIPDELMRVVPEVECPLPDKGTLALWCYEVEYSFGKKVQTDEIPAEVLAALQGMTTSEVRNAISTVLYEKGKLSGEDAPELAKMKQQLINSTEYLTFVDTDINIEDIGGMDLLKDWIHERELVHSPESKAFGIRPPKGILLVGPPGTGKTLAAKIIAKMWKWPLIELEAGSLFGSYLGESERNTRQALALIDSFSPCVLLIDEIEKGLSAGSRDVYTDETSLRVISMIMKWMQNRESDVFIVATANSVEDLPPEVLRKGRFDEVFFADLPTLKERVEILSIHLRKRGHELFSAGEMEEIAKAAEGYAGSEMEHSIETALIKAFSENRQLTAEDVINALKATPPLSVRHGERILASRISGRKHGIPVSSEKSMVGKEYDTSLGYR